MKRLLVAVAALAQAFGESATDAAVRETFEDTGLKVELTGLLNVFSVR